MNDRAREALVAASLSGVPQIKWLWTDGKDGRCAMGVLVEAIDWNMAQFDETYGTSQKERTEIVQANNVLEWDFLTIARKIGQKDEA